MTTTPKPEILLKAFGGYTPKQAFEAYKANGERPVYIIEGERATHTIESDDVGAVLISSADHEDQYLFITGEPGNSITEDDQWVVVYDQNGENFAA